ncbi:hypothetical protein G7046_g6181 [Stylonectria norvegica]|nr:hypothetical protein G7046_g6181 [Stylonectria norvegica]
MTSPSEPLDCSGCKHRRDPLYKSPTADARLAGMANSKEPTSEEQEDHEASASLRRTQSLGVGYDEFNLNSLSNTHMPLSTGAIAPIHVVQPVGTGAMSSSFPSRSHHPPISPDVSRTSAPIDHGSNNTSTSSRNIGSGYMMARRIKAALAKFCSFIGPGFMIAVAYIDPGNYATDIAAGASYRFRLLFVVLLSNIFAIFLQSLAIKLGTVSGLNLAEACREFLPRWLNYVLYVFAEVAIIATDIAEVIGFAIALNLLIPQVPLVAGCAVSIGDVLVTLLFYRPEKSMKGLRIFEYFIMCVVLGVVVCFCIQLSLIKETSVGEVFKGYLPSGAIVERQGLVIPNLHHFQVHLTYEDSIKRSGIVQPRLREYDARRGLLPPEPLRDSSSIHDDVDKGYYIPSLAAIQYSLKVSIAEVAIALFTFALFINSAILIVAGASLYNNPKALDADIFSIHDLLSKSISPAAGTIFALALLLSGVSAGIVCTISGQMVSEGALRWKIRPWLRRLMTRSISITPSIIIAGAVGRSGLNTALNASQVALSIILPFVTAPLIYFTCRDKYMTIQSAASRERLRFDGTGPISLGQRPEPAQHVEGDGDIKMGNSWYTAAAAIIVWVIITVMNVANLVLLGKGQ